MAANIRITGPIQVIIGLISMCPRHRGPQWIIRPMAGRVTHHVDQSEVHGRTPARVHGLRRYRRRAEGHQ